jgi:MOSC domain-containing protein
MSLNLTSIHRYPVKSCRGEDLAEAIVEPWGLAGDRRWMIVSPDGSPLTARERPPLVLITPSFDGTEMTLTAPGEPLLTVKVPAGGDLVPVSVWGYDLLAAQAGDEAAAWLTRVAGEPVRLVYLDDPTRRQVDPRYAQDADRVSFADGYPLLLTSEASLAALNTLIEAGPFPDEAPLPMTRFRPNVVVAGAEAWAEDSWQRLLIGDVAFRAAKGCDRCVFTTIDPDTAVKGKEPLRTLARYRRWDGKVWFGVNLIPDNPAPDATIRRGDPVVLY